MKSYRIPHNRTAVSSREVAEISKAVASGWVGHGPYVERFEDDVCGFMGGQGYAAAVSSGTAAIFLALKALGVGSGHDVLAPTYVCSALLNAIYLAGARPVLVDINERDFNISVEDARSRITRNAKAIIAPHIYGFPADINALTRLKLPVIEDCAQAIGATVGGRKVGTFGDIAICSFYATKMLTTGHGGMVYSKHRGLIDAVKDYRSFDCRKSYEPRFNFHMSDIQAACGVSQMRQLPGFIKRRRHIAGLYAEAIARGGNALLTQEAGRGVSPVYYRFVARSDSGLGRLAHQFEKAGIRTIVPIETYELLHRYLKKNPAGFSCAEKVARTTLSIPLYPALTDREVKSICGILGRY